MNTKMTQAKESRSNAASRLALRKLVAEVLGLEVSVVPNQWIYFLPSEPAFARAVTLRNAINVLIRAQLGETITLRDLAWHHHYRNNDEILAALRRENYYETIPN